MTLASGTRIGSHELGAILGVGGMGEVYRARDIKLNRDVALRLLPEDFASDGDRLARLRREAQVLASLNHPHVAAIYGLEEAAGKLALVLELVEGDAFRAEKPRPWSPALVRPRGPWRSFDLHRDEKRVAVLKGEEGSAEVKPDHVVFIENFFGELRRLAPAGER